MLTSARASRQLVMALSHTAAAKPCYAGCKRALGQQAGCLPPELLPKVPEQVTAPAEELSHPGWHFCTLVLEASSAP